MGKKKKEELKIISLIKLLQSIKRIFLILLQAHPIYWKKVIYEMNPKLHQLVGRLVRSDFRLRF